MRAVSGRSERGVQEFNGIGRQRPRAAVAGNTQGKEVMQHRLDITTGKENTADAGSAAR